MFIKLTDAKKNAPIFLNPDKIVALFKYIDNNAGGIGTKILVISQDTFHVRETPEQVMKLVGRAMHSRQE